MLGGQVGLEFSIRRRQFRIRERLDDALPFAEKHFPRIECRVEDSLAWLQLDFIVLDSFIDEVAVHGIRDSYLTPAGAWE